MPELRIAHLILLSAPTAARGPGLAGMLLFIRTDF